MTEISRDENLEAAMPVRPKLSAVIISRNEEDDLPGLISNLQGWVDEIVVVDDCSTDGTPEILRKNDDKLKWINRERSEADGFAGQRNAGIEAATGEWLLHLDCDERLPRSLCSEIDRRLCDTRLNAFRYRRQNFFLHRPVRHGGWSSWNRPQLARRGFHRFEDIVHERCVIDGGDEMTGQLDAPMLHLNDASFEERLRKSAQYVALNADRLIANRRRISGFAIFAGTVSTFIKRYILQAGFRDGTPGLIAALHGATAVFRERAMAWDVQNAIPREQVENMVESWQERTKNSDS